MKLRAKLAWMVVTTIVATSTVLLHAMAQQPKGDPQAFTRNYIRQYFAASENLFVFPVAFDRPKGVVQISTTSGLAIMDRRTNRTRVIYDARFAPLSLWLSADGERLLFVRHEDTTEQNELLSCMTATWRCRILLRTKDSIVSPLELDAGTILYSSSPTIVSLGGHRIYGSHDLHLLKEFAEPRRISDFRVIQLGDLNVVGREIIFSAYSPNDKSPAIPRDDPVAREGSQIYAIEFDRAEGRVRAPTQKLQSIYRMRGYATRPTVSGTGELIAYLNNRLDGTGLLNLVVSTIAGSIQVYAKTSGLGFSRPSFVDDTVFANELFADRYEIKQIGPYQRFAETVAVLRHSTNEIEKLERLEFTIEN